MHGDIDVGIVRMGLGATAQTGKWTSRVGQWPQDKKYGSIMYDTPTGTGVLLYCYIIVWMYSVAIVVRSTNGIAVREGNCGVSSRMHRLNQKEARY